MQGATVSAQLVPPAPDTSSGIPWHWFLVLALVLGAVLLAPSRK